MCRILHRYTVLAQSGLQFEKATVPGFENWPGCKVLWENENVVKIINSNVLGMVYAL